MFNALMGLVNTVLSWLPTSPFANITLNVTGDGLGWLNWFIPVGRIMNTMLAWLGAIALYYLASIMLRWVKAIQ